MRQNVSYDMIYQIFTGVNRMSHRVCWCIGNIILEEHDISLYGLELVRNVGRLHTKLHDVVTQKRENVNVICVIDMHKCGSFNGFGVRLRWSRGSMLAFGTQVRGFIPGRSRRNFQGEKILSTPSFGREVKPFVPCRRFTACKRSLNVSGSRAFSGKIHRPFLAQVFPPLTTRVSGGDTCWCE